MGRIIQKKLDRLAGGGRPRMLDLFGGCGGLTLGFHRAGCTPLAALELDPLAAQSYATNFHPDASPAEFERHAQSRDITTSDPLTVLRELGIKSPTTAVDFIVGGPPCPAYTRVGRAKLREIHEHPEAFIHDPRAKLYVPFLRFIKELRPIAVVMENVPDLLNFGGHNLGEEIADTLDSLGYDSSYTLLNSAHHGVPQMRERFFLVATHRDAATDFEFPQPLCAVNFPRGYEGTRDVATKHIRQSGLFSEQLRYVDPPKPNGGAVPPVSVEEALGDLPSITEHLRGEMPRGARRFDKAVGYRPDASPSPYAIEMRKWPRFESRGEIFDHVTRSLSDRDYRLFQRMSPGDDYPRAHALATKLFERAVAKELARGKKLREGSDEYLALKKSYVPPYDAGKFPNKWRKMDPDQPARTLMAHLGKDSYTHIHYDSAQARVLSVREAARLQSFPDGFVFAGTMNPAFRQIGNAVPPLLANAVAKSLLAALRVPVRGPAE